SSATRALFPAVARVVLAARNGRLLDQLRRLGSVQPPVTRRRTRLPVAVSSPIPAAQASPDAGLECFNGLGGFADGGKEYVTILTPGQC
ncbi:hypothetical protein PUT90_27930, partial [Klebsiella pneumoniae]|uniref:hypothetical protein n=1 Tax=Klebsiella pneumoniae TaxID=573 RepID=UPI002366DC7A